jgi:hypothetical protein
MLGWGRGVRMKRKSRGEGKEDGEAGGGQWRN